MAENRSSMSRCRSRLAVGFAFLSVMILSTQASASEPDRAQTVQVIHDLAEARLRGSKTELRMAEQKLAGTTQLRALGHASIQGLRKARLERDAARHWHRAAVEFARIVNEQLPDFDESAAVLRPAPELWSSPTQGQRIGIVTVSDSKSGLSAVSPGTTTGTTIRERLRALDTQRTLLERRDRELRALQSDDPQIAAEQKSTRQQIARLRWQSALVLNEWYLNEIAARTIVEADSRSTPQPSPAPRELLAQTIAIAQQQSAVRGRIGMAEARLDWSRELAASVKSLRDMGHASHADLENAQLAVRQSEAALATVLRESRRSADIAQQLGRHFQLSSEERTGIADFTVTSPADQHSAESIVGRIRSVNSTEAENATNNPNSTNDSAAPIHDLGQKIPNSLLATHFQQEWKQIANRVEHQVARLELQHSDWRISTLADLERSGAASPGELRFARIRRHLLATRLLDTEDDRKLLALQRRQIEFVIARLNSHGEAEEAPRQLAELTDWRPLKLLQPTRHAKQVAATPASRIHHAAQRGFSIEPASQGQ